MDQEMKDNELCTYAVEWLRQYKKEGLRYFVIKVEDFLKCLTEEEVMAFDEMLVKYNESRLPKPINKYYVINRDEYVFNNAEEFFSVIKKYKNTQIKKLGDKVKIKTTLKVGAEYEMNHGNYTDTFVGEMVEFLGKEAVITRVDENGYTLDIDDFWTWTDEMLE